MSSTEQINWNHWIYRLIAYIIDCVIVGIPAAIIYWLAILPLVSVNINYGFGVVMSVPPWWASLLLPLILGIMQLLYFMALDSYWGATLGKRMLHMQVQTVNGAKVTFDKSFIRNISKIYGLFLFLDWLIGIITPGDKRQKFTDRSAGTIVTRVGQPETYVPPPPPPPPPPTQ